jgi:hypothetical protein
VQEPVVGLDVGWWLNGFDKIPGKRQRVLLLKFGFKNIVVASTAPRKS